MTEPYIQIGDHVLTEAQAIAVRVAISVFHIETASDDFKREIGPISDGYHARLGEVLTIIIHADGQPEDGK